jgi:choline-sulfatase
MSRKPNILLILTDQHSPHIAGFAGDGIVNTAALDRLASRSTRFDAAYCQAPLCVPSRTSLLTGKYAYRCSAWDNGSVLFPEHVTLPAWLGHHGYVTAAVGKMHFRGAEQMHGFQHRPYGDLVEGRFPAHQPDPPDTADGRWNRHSIGRFPFAGPSSFPENMLIDGVVTRESLAWLMEFAGSDREQPWFFVASYPRPHFPLTAPGRYFHRYLDSDLELPELPEGYPGALHPHDRFVVDDFNLLKFTREEQRRALAAYYACVDYVDDCIGELLAGLEQAGCLENTYVAYASDHGDMAGEHGLWWKRTYYDASSRVPLLISEPDIGEGAAQSAPVEIVDLFPTCCEWAGINQPEGLDGESLVPLLSGRQEDRRKRTARSDLLGGRPETRFRMIRDGRWKVVEFPAAPPRLFDLVNDPAESRDLALNPPGEAPMDELMALLAEGGDWDELERRLQADRDRAGEIRRLSDGSVQYQLADGRIVEADAHLYPPDQSQA